VGTLTKLDCNKPDPNVVDILDSFASKAKAGEVRATVILVLLSDGTYAFASPGRWKSHLEILGAINHMGSRLENRLSEGAVAVEI
jgi:hypothetical protein